MECQDCNKNEAEYIIFDKQKGESFLVCSGCISSEDIVMNHSIADIIRLCGVD